MKLGTDPRVNQPTTDVWAWELVTRSMSIMSGNKFHHPFLRCCGISRPGSLVAGSNQLLGHPERQALGAPHASAYPTQSFTASHLLSDCPQGFQWEMRAPTEAAE